MNKEPSTLEGKELPATEVIAQKEKPVVIPKPRPVVPKTTAAAGKTVPKEAALPKPPLPKIDIKKITIDGAVQGLVSPGRPLLAMVDVSASEDFAGPFAVTLELKMKEEKQIFTEKIETLNKGLTVFKWDLTEKPVVGSYVLSVEIANSALKLKDKSSKMFRVGEKKVPGLPVRVDKSNN